jgi:hypothetical protein
LGEIPHAQCDRINCTNLIPNTRNHRELLGGPHLVINKTQKYRIPEKLVMYLAKNLLDSQFPTPPPSPLVDSNPPRAWELDEARTFVKALEIPPIQFSPKKSTSLITKRTRSWNMSPGRSHEAKMSPVNLLRFRQSKGQIWKSAYPNWMKKILLSKTPWFKGMRKRA